MKRNRMVGRFAFAAALALIAACLLGCGEEGGGAAEGDHHEHSLAGASNDSPDGGGAAAGHGDAGHTEDEDGQGHEGGAEAEAHGAGDTDVEVLTASPGVIERTVELPGEIVLNADHVVHVIPRVRGIVREVYKALGDDVAEGEIMAVIESRELADVTAEYLASLERLALARTVFEREEALWLKKISSEQEFLNAKKDMVEARIASRAAEQKLLALGLSRAALDELPSRSESDLTRYEIRAPVGGTIIRKAIGLGEALEENAEVYVVADLGSVWVDIHVYQDDLPSVREGQRVSITVAAGGPSVEGVIRYVGPILGEETRTALARVVLPNPERDLRPGTFVTAAVFLDEVSVPVAVPKIAVQALNGESVVFVWTGTDFRASVVTTGRSSADSVEIVSGLDAGQRYAATGAFDLKARLVTGSMDSHAGHGH